MSILTAAPTATLSTSGRGPATGRPVASGQPNISASEQRLRAVIESAPVSIIALKPDGDVVAANKAALELLGAKQVVEVLGRSIREWVTSEDRDGFAEFVNRVCGGEAGTFVYRLMGPGDTRRAVETRAIPLRREGHPTTFLAVTWEAADRASQSSTEALAKQDLLNAEVNALKESLDSAKSAYDTVLRDHEEAQRQLRDTQAQLEAIRTDVEHRENALAGQWSAERAMLETRLRESQDREVELSARRDTLEQTVRELHTREVAVSREREAVEATVRDFERKETVWATQQNDLEARLRAAEAREAGVSRQLEAEQAAWAQERAQITDDHARAIGEQRSELEQMAKLAEAMHANYEGMLVGSRAERDELAATVHLLERQYADVVRERDAERHQLATLVSAIKSATDDAARLLAPVAALEECARSAGDFACDGTEDEVSNRAADDSESAAESPWAF